MKGQRIVCNCGPCMNILKVVLSKCRSLVGCLTLRSILSLGTCQKGLKTKQKKQIDSQVSFLVIVDSRAVGLIHSAPIWQAV